MRAKEGGKETTGETALRLPSVPFPWSLAVHHQSLAFRARLCHAKNEAPEEEAGLITYLAYGAKYVSRQDRFGTRETRFVDHLNGITKLSIILRSERLRLKRSVILLRQLYRFLCFFLEDKTSAPDVVSSCLLIPCAHFETSLVMVSCYGYEI